MSDRAPLRALRGGVAGALCALGAIVGHAAGGQLPAWPLVVAVVVVGTLLCTGLAFHRLDLRRLLLAAICVQASSHLLLAVPVEAAHLSRVAEPDHAAALLIACASPLTVATGGPWVLVAHLVVAVVAAVVARSADQALLTLARDLLARLRPFLLGPTPVRRRARAVLTLRVPAPTSLVALGGPGLRGPPVAAAGTP